MTSIVFGIIAVVTAVMIAMYNRLVRLRQQVDQTWSDVAVQLKQRRDLVPNMVEAVKRYAEDENSRLEAVTQARAAAATAASPEALAKSETVLSGALRQLFGVAEDYPDLKANQIFIQLQTELADVEGKIAVARSSFNNAVAQYNTAIETIPMVLMAGPMGMQPRDFFELDKAEQSATSGSPSAKF